MSNPLISPLPQDLPVLLPSHLLPVEGPDRFRRGARMAAVVAILYTHDGEWRMPFVRRSADVPDHPGQVALPGGIIREAEDAWAAAAREAEEEIGADPAKLRPLGAGAAAYASVSNFSIVPFVAWLEHTEPAFVHDPRELDGVLIVPLHVLLDESAWISPDPASAWIGPRLDWDGSTIWGLTAHLLQDLLPRIRAASGGPAPP